MTDERRTPRRHLQRLGTRLNLLLTFAILPIGVFAMVQANTLLGEAQARTEAALMGETLRAVQPQVRLIEKAEGAAEALARLAPAAYDDPARCGADVRSLVERSANFASATLYRADGQVACAAYESASVRLTPPLDPASRFDDGPGLRLTRATPVSEIPTLHAIHPVRDARGGLLGYSEVSVEHRALMAAATRENEGAVAGSSASIATFTGTGHLVAASTGLAEAEPNLPRDRALRAFVNGPPTAFTALNNAGEERVYSVVPLVAGQLHAISWQPVADWPVATLGGISPVLLPAMMWLVSIIVASVAMERQVSRHVRSLRSAILSFAGGGRTVGRLDFDRAPLEIHEVAEAFARMTETILHDEAELEDMVHQKEVLLREVHHRVKNNLQLISSILNMQIRQSTNAETREAMRGLQERITSLATIHRELYQTSGLTDISADELLEDIVRQVVSIGVGPGRRFDLKTTFDDIRLTPDQAVSLSLLLTEALANALKYGGATEGRTAELDVSLRRVSASHVVLQVRNSANPSEVATQGSGLGTQLLRAFAAQLGGDVEREVRDGAYILRVTFARRALVEAENRHHPEALQRAAN